MARIATECGCLCDNISLCVGLVTYSHCTQQGLCICPSVRLSVHLFVCPIGSQRCCCGFAAVDRFLHGRCAADECGSVALSACVVAEHRLVNNCQIIKLSASLLRYSLSSVTVYGVYVYCTVSRYKARHVTFGHNLSKCKPILKLFY